MRPNPMSRYANVPWKEVGEEIGRVGESARDKWTRCEPSDKTAGRWSEVSKHSGASSTAAWL